MNDFSVRVAARLVRMWTRLYTAGIAPDLRDRRRAEIESDLWESRRQPHRGNVAAQIISRLVLGVPDDLAWRRSYRGAPTMARVAAIGAIAAGVFISWLLIGAGRAAVLPAPAPLTHRARTYPDPPPPPPPPCPPDGIGATSPMPCAK
jgi:hypothetical protein